MQFYGQDIGASPQAAGWQRNLHGRRDSWLGGQSGRIGFQCASRQVAPVDLPAIQVEGCPIIVSGPEFQSRPSQVGWNHEPSPKISRLGRRRGQAAIRIKSAAGRALQQRPKTRRIR